MCSNIWIQNKGIKNCKTANLKSDHSIGSVCASSVIRLTEAEWAVSSHYVNNILKETSLKLSAARFQ